MSKPDNPQAFPKKPEPKRLGSEYRSQEGMTLLDYFAAQALESALIIDDGTYDFEEVARITYEIAEAMLKEREKRMS